MKYFLSLLDPWAAREAPKTYFDDGNSPGYVITPDRLQQIRQSKLYPFFDKVQSHISNDHTWDIRLATQ